MQSNTGRPRGKSSAEQELLSGEISIEDLTMMKLMEEIIEYDQEIKMKQQWINTRMRLLHKLLPKQENKQTIASIETFMRSMQPDYPNKITYGEPSGAEASAIPMGMADVVSKPIELG